MKKIFIPIISCLLAVLCLNTNTYAGCAPGESYVEIQINSDGYMAIDGTDFTVTIGGTLVYTNSVDGPVPINATTTVVSGCFPEGAPILIDLTADAFGDGWGVNPPFFIIEGCSR